MESKLDAARDRSVGSLIPLAGTVFDMHLTVEETVMERNSPRNKAWETVGNPKLLVIGHYRMGFTSETQSDGSLVKVYIDYAMPPKWPAGWLGLFVWLVLRQMVYTADASRRSNVFSSTQLSSALRKREQ